MKYGEEWLSDPITIRVMESLDEAIHKGYIRLLTAARTSSDPNVVKFAASIDMINQLKSVMLEQGELEDEQERQ